MSGEYQRPAPTPGGLRLHLNENGAGCSPKVLGVLGQLTRRDAACYPDYDAAIDAVAARFALPRDRVLLTNGLDEGIFAATAAAFRDRSSPGIPAALTVVPAFDMYGVCANALGGRMVEVPMTRDFRFPAAALRDAISSRTRIVFVTNPHNPSGQIVERDAILDLARQATPALVFVDEAYADFSGETIVDDEAFRAAPNLLVGRTFAKAYGLAGLRAGAVLGMPDTLAPLRCVVPPYSLNAWAAAAVPAALADRVYYDWYIAQVAESKTLLAGACARLGLSAWTSAGNFLLVDAGSRASAIAGALGARGILVRDRSRDAGCAGCLRITAGVVEDTRRLVAALEEVVCAVEP